MDLKDKIEELFQTTPDYIHGVSFGFKTVNGQQTQDLAIVFHTDKKFPKKYIPENEIIPEFITIDGTTYPTDVIHDSAPKNFACYNISETGPSNEVLPHRQKHRPIKGGTVICSTSNCGYSYDEYDTNKIKPYSVGTLGAIVVDNTTNTLVGLTAGHVLSKEITSPTFRNLQSIQSTNILYPQKLNIIDNNGNLTESQSVSVYNQEVYQFNESSGIDISLNDAIGTPKRYSTLSGRYGNTVDAGVFTLTKNAISMTGSNVQLGLDGTLNMPFANSGEIYDIFTGQKTILSAGRTTGPKNSDCNLKIKSLYTSINISGYYENNILTGFGFSNLIGFGDSSNGSDPAAAGDSGSILYADCGGKNKIIGLIFAGSQSGSNNAYACTIDNITGRLNIKAWTGNLLNFDNIKYKKAFITGSNQNSERLIKDGETYFQAGIYSNFIGPVNVSNLITSNTTINPDGTLTIDPNNPINSTQNQLPDDPSNDGLLDIKNTDMFLSDFSASAGSSAYSIIAQGKLTNSNLDPINNATIIYKIENLNGDTSLRGMVSTVSTDAQGIFTIISNNTAKDSPEFRVKILDAKKSSYSFRPDLSIKNEAYATGDTTDVPSNPYTPPPMSPSPSTPSSGNSGESAGNNDSGSTSGSGSGGDTSSGGKDPNNPLDPTGTGSGTGGGDTGGKGSGTKKGPPAGGYISCCDTPSNIQSAFSADVNILVNCISTNKGLKTRIEIGAELAIRNNPITCKGNNLQAYLTVGGQKIAFKPWITYGTTMVSTDSLILSPSQFDKILNAASGGLSPVNVIIHGSLNSAISVRCDDNKLRNAQVSFKVNTPFKYISWNESASADQVQGPHCIGTESARCSNKKCPAKCCDCCAQVESTGVRELVLAYADEFGNYYWTKNPCTGFPNVDSQLVTELFTCALDCDCVGIENPNNNEPQFSATKTKKSVSCERSNQFCYQCTLQDEGCPPGSYGTSLFNIADILPLGSELSLRKRPSIYKPK